MKKKILITVFILIALLFVLSKVGFQIGNVTIGHKEDNLKGKHLEDEDKEDKFHNSLSMYYLHHDNKHDDKYYYKYVIDKYLSANIIEHNDDEINKLICQQKKIEIEIKNNELLKLKPFEGHPNKIYKTGDTCVICLVNSVYIVFGKCGHCCTCLNCTYSINKCCVCRVPIDSKILMLHECNQNTIIAM